MKTRKLLLALPALVTLLVTTACDNADGTSGGPAPDLVVEYSDWNGWDPDYVAEPLFADLVGAVGEKVELETMGGITLEVVAVDGDEITVETSEEMAPRNGNGINLNDLTDTFVLSPHDPAAFATATMDAGWNFEVRYDEDEAKPTSPSPTCAPESVECGEPLE